jgi:sugar phosphate isomerase/epimerase
MEVAEMARLSINELTTLRWTFEQDVQGYAAAGVTAMGVWRQKLSDFGEERGIELLRDHSMKVSNLLWAGGFTGSDGLSHVESIHDAIEAVHLAAAMQADCLVIYAGSRAGHTHNHSHRMLRAALSKVLPVAAREQVPLALEPMHVGCAQEWTFLTDLDETIELLEEFDSPYLKLAFDTYHLGHEETIVQRAASLVDQIAIVHLGDAAEPPWHEQNRLPLGQGILPLKAIVESLTEAGYTGCYDVELMGESLETTPYEELLELSKTAFEQWCEPESVRSPAD